MTAPRIPAHVGLCATCIHVRPVETDRAAVYYRCDYASHDPSFAKYPTLPVLRCSAHELRRKPKALVSWSGGKDACVALHRVRHDVEFIGALTMMDETGDRSRSHGLRVDVMRAQVAALGYPWITRRCSWDTYEAQFVDALREARRLGAEQLVCGDILYPDHRAWVERVCQAADLTAVEPLFGDRTIDVYREFLAFGGVAHMVAVDARVLGPEWLFRRLDEAALLEFSRLGVDPCGENGEYHTLVTSCPAFRQPLAVEPGEQVERRGYLAIDVHRREL